MQNEIKYFVQGTHCASCELIIERKLLELPNIKAVNVSGNEVSIEYTGQKPDRYSLNKLFSKEGYKFFNKTGESQVENNPVNWLVVSLSIILAFLVYLLINKTGLLALVRVDKTSSLPSFLIFGLLAGLSTCAALVGGIVLSMAKNWSVPNGTWFQRMKPHLVFNSGRIISFSLVGIVLGSIGQMLKVSPIITALIILFVSLYMLLSALNLLGVSALGRLGLKAPRFITRYSTHSSSNVGPFVIGSLTFLLPCGFTLTAEGLALLSGSFLQGMLIMLAFVLGTLIPLLLIGLGSTALYENKFWSANFSRIAGILLIIFTIFNFNAAFNILGFRISSTSRSGTSVVSPSDDSVQVIKMNATSSGYSPNYFKVKAGVPVRWEITDKGASGCTNVIVSKSFFPNQIKLENGKTAVKEFTPKTPGKYRFSCWMGMVSGTIEVTS